MPDKDGHRTHWTSPGAPWRRTLEEAPGSFTRMIQGRAGVVYIAGPMRGYPYFNFPAFDQAAAVLTAAGFTVLSPAAHDRSLGFDETLYPTGDLTAAVAAGFSLRDSFRWDVDRIFDAGIIALLDGYEYSLGAKAELALARVLGLRELHLVSDKVTGHIFDYYEVK